MPRLNQKGQARVLAVMRWLASVFQPLENTMSLVNLVARTATREELVELLRQHDTEIVKLKKREDILASAMAEVKATDEGKSTQPISRIVAGCISELAALR